MLSHSQHRFLGNQSAPMRVEKHRNRKTPASLSAYTPVRPRFKHPGDPLFTPPGNPFHFFNIFKRRITQAFARIRQLFIHTDKPLLCRPENHRLLTPPAMRVTVHNLALGEKQFLSPQVVVNYSFNFQNILPLQPLRHRIIISPVVHHRRINSQTIFLPRHIVLNSMPRRSMNKSRPVFGCNVQRR